MTYGLLIDNKCTAFLFCLETKDVRLNTILQKQFSVQSAKVNSLHSTEKMLLRFCVGVMACAVTCMSAENETVLFDFTKAEDVASWTEQSDTLRSVGKSKAVIVIQQTQMFRRAIFFSLLNPQPNGAAFAGVRTDVSLDLAGYKSFALKVRGQGNNKSYKVVLRHKGENDEPFPSYCHFFEAPFDDFSTVTLHFKDFLAYYRGKVVTDAQPLDVANISNFGLQVYGGVYQPIKQFGASSLEIDWISVLK